ncbi:MAG: hypothetical protein AAGF31_07845 [Planctomycetota bacterium]
MVLAFERTWLRVLLALATAPMCLADESLLEVTPIAEGLDQPVGLVVRPAALDTRNDQTVDQLFVCEAATGRVLSATIGRNDSADFVPVTMLVDAGGASAAPTAAWFLDRQTLLVAVNEANDQERGIRVLQISDGPVAAVTREQQIGELLPQKAPVLVGSYRSLAAGSRYVYCAFQSVDGGGRLLRARHTAGGVSGLRLLATAEGAPDEAAPVALAMNDRGYLVAVYSPIDPQAPSQLAFIAPELIAGVGLPVLLDLDLASVVAISYSPMPRPVERRLYALAADGLYRIDAAIDERGRSATRTTKLAELTDPTAMAFAADGTLYVAVRGSIAAEGSVVRIDGEL